MPDSSALAYNYDLGRANHKRDHIHFQVQFAVVGNGINLVKHAEFLFRFFFYDVCLEPSLPGTWSLLGVYCVTYR
jgi:hypothetical protein